MAQEFLEAAIAGDVLKIEALYDAGVPLDVRDQDGATAIMLAARQQHHLVVATLMNLGARTDVKDYAGRGLVYYENPPEPIKSQLGPETINAILARTLILDDNE